MPSNFVENPELNKLYLIKRNKSGDPSKRYQPGVIIEIVKPAPNMATSFVTVHWLFEDAVEKDVMMFYGLTKVLTRKWIDAEAIRKTAEAKALSIALAHIDRLRFDPEHMDKVTA